MAAIPLKGLGFAKIRPGIIKKGAIEEEPAMEPAAVADFPHMSAGVFLSAPAAEIRTFGRGHRSSRLLQMGT